jgi:hypothetical protein
MMGCNMTWGLFGFDYNRRFGVKIRESQNARQTLCVFFDFASRGFRKRTDFILKSDNPKTPALHSDARPRTTETNRATSLQWTNDNSHTLASDVPNYKILQMVRSRFGRLFHAVNTIIAERQFVEGTDSCPACMSHCKCCSC